DGDDRKDTSMFAQDDGLSNHESVFALMSKSDDKDDEEKELRALAKVLIDAYHGLINEKDMLRIELDQNKVENISMANRVTKLNEELREASRETSKLNNELKK
ncbi:hypothetical protein HAX54_047049, partial [Datura stramonium]|nr:hypothetical protein [Datura stramonium]